MFIDFEKYNRQTLTKDQQEFLERVIPWGKFIQEQTRRKAQLLRRLPSKYGLFASVAISDILIQSNWGEHPLAQSKYKNKLANNLALLTGIGSNEIRKIKYNDKEYRLFDDWEHFAICYSDWIVWSGMYIDSLLSNNLYEQQLRFGVRRDNSQAYNEKIFILTSIYRLEEFDTWTYRAQQSF